MVAFRLWRPEIHSPKTGMSEPIRFFYQGQVRELRDVKPTQTILQHLREDLRCTGTKEGCAEGDCGACTVVLGSLEDGELALRAVNACIQFTPTLDGKALFTVEDLAQPGGAPHPVQQALVECHGSQCGFCTPGFVMSLFALSKSVDAVPNQDAINDALAGNLCRCTGYAPIVRAAERVCAGINADCFDQREAQTISRLETLRDEETISIESVAGTFYAPATMDALAEFLLAAPHATIVAGSTDVGLWVTKHMRKLDPVVWIGRVRDLQHIDDTGDTIEIGAGVTYADATALLARYYPDLGEIFRRLGSTQIRNVGTIGGNIANGSPIGDASPALIALGATLYLRCGAKQRSLPLEDFFVAYGKQDRGPGEFVERISVPKPLADARFRAYKISKRFDQDISAVMGAFLLRLDDDRVVEARVAFGGMAATPMRAAAVERVLTGRSFDKTAVAAVKSALAQDFSPISDMRASANYRARVAQNLIARLHIELMLPAEETRLIGAEELAHV